MVITVNSTGAVLQDADDFKGFKVVIENAADTAPIADIGRWIDDEHVVVDAAAVRRLAGDTAREPGWEDGFSKMLAYADSKGWLVDGGIRAHVERAGD